jgi:hypothetical protein
VRHDSTYTQFADDAPLVSTIGLDLNATRQRLLAAVSDAGANTRHGGLRALPLLTTICYYEDKPIF